jgi:hypothetical protein
MEDRENRKEKLKLYEVHPYYELLDKIVRERVAIELEEMSEHPSLSGDMKWALAHAAKMIVAKED